MNVSEDKSMKIHLEIPRKLGEKIAKIRRFNRLSQSDLAELVGKDRQYIYKIEKGKVTSNIATISLLAYALEISLSELFENIEV